MKYPGQQLITEVGYHTNISNIIHRHEVLQMMPALRIKVYFQFSLQLIYNAHVWEDNSYKLPS